MSCLVKSAGDEPCVLCKRPDQVYIGHGQVRFCAHCSISWDPIETESFVSKAVVMSDDQDGDLPEDMLERMGVLVGGLTTVFAFGRRLAELMAVPEGLFADEQESEDEQKHLPGRHNQATHGRGGSRNLPDRDITGGWVPPGDRVWQGTSTDPPPISQRLTKLQTGHIGEQMAMKALEDVTRQPFADLNRENNRNNNPVDIAGDHRGTEVKASAEYSQTRAWRARLGEPGKAEKVRRRELTRKAKDAKTEHERKMFLAAKRAEGDEKRRMILQRKAAEIDRLTALNDGQRINPTTVGVILSTDGRRGDVFEVQGHHLYLGWSQSATESNYLGTYDVGDLAHAETLAKTTYSVVLLDLFDGTQVEFPGGHSLSFYQNSFYQNSELDEQGFTQAEIDVLVHPQVDDRIRGFELDDIQAIANNLASSRIDLNLLTDDIFETVIQETDMEMAAATIDKSEQSWLDFEEEFKADWVEAEAIAEKEFARLKVQGFFKPPTEESLGKAAPDWEDSLGGFSPVMVLVHDTMRLYEEDQNFIYDEILKSRIVEYEDAISDYIAQMGCGGKAHVTSQKEIEYIKDQSREDAQSILNTHNRDLAKTIRGIKDDVPTANRSTYTSRFRIWNMGRQIWKATQIALHTTLTTRDYALKTFSDHNNLEPNVKLFPRTAKEPICQGWINRGLVNYEVAERNPSPYHLNCVHYWKPMFRIGKCEGLWIG